MQAEIKGTTMPILEVSLNQGEQVVSTHGELAWMTDSITMSQTQPFYGVVYFPNEPITVSTSSVICGSIVGSNVTVSSSPAIHYDNALRSPDSLAGDAAFAYITAPITVNSLLASVP